MQGIIVTPSGDVWALDFGDDKVVYMPKGDPSQGEVLLPVYRRHAQQGQPVQIQWSVPSGHRPAGPNLDHQRHRRHGHALSRERPEQGRNLYDWGASGKGMAIDSKGNAWITNTVGRDSASRRSCVFSNSSCRCDAHRRSITSLFEICWSTRAWEACRCCDPTAARRRDHRSIRGSIWGAWAVLDRW